MPVLSNLRANAVSLMPVPTFIKRAAIDGFLTLTSELDAQDFELLISRNASLWHDIVPAEVKTFLCDGAKRGANKFWVNIANPELAHAWVIEARPELSSVLNARQGKIWFFKTFFEIKDAVQE